MAPAELALRRDLATTAAARTYALLRAQHPGVLEPFADVTALLAFCQDRDPNISRQQDQVLAVLVARVQAKPADRMTRQIILLTFLPRLDAVRHRTRVTVQSDDDVTASLLEAFIEAVHAYPRHRSGSISIGLMQETKKRYFRALADEYEAITAAVPLSSLNASLRAPEPDGDDPWPPADEVRVYVQANAPEDADLLWATVAEGMDLRRYLESRGLATGVRSDDDRAMNRLRQRRCRALHRLRSELAA